MRHAIEHFAVVHLSGVGLGDFAELADAQHQLWKRRQDHINIAQMQIRRPRPHLALHKVVVDERPTQQHGRSVFVALDDQVLDPRDIAIVGRVEERRQQGRELRRLVEELLVPACVP